MGVKQVIVIRTDLKNTNGQKVRTGKLFASACHGSRSFMQSAIEHAYDGVYEISLSDVEMEWLGTGTRTIVLKIDSEKEMFDLREEALKQGLKAYIITDFGYTEFAGPTNTCLAIGPDLDEKIDAITKGLSLL